MSEAAALYRQGLEAFGRGATDRSRELNDDRYARAHSAIGLARVAAERGEKESSRGPLAEADRVRLEAGLVFDPADRPEYDRTVEPTGTE
jgi:hypothetical protein